MMIKLAGCLLLAALLASCETTAKTTTTTTTTSREKLADRVLAKRIASNSPALPTTDSSTDPAPPAAGPDEITSEEPELHDPNRNPALVPTPMLRYWASSRTP